MTHRKPPALKVQSFAAHQVITQPNPLRKVMRQVDEKDLDDPIARAEQALVELSVEFKGWMSIECARLATVHAAILKDGFSAQNREELFRATHDIKGDAATFGYPSAAAAAESLCRIIEHAVNIDDVPEELITHHVNAIQAIFREQGGIDITGTAEELSTRLRRVADEYLIHVNRDRPEHLEAILAPSIVPDD